MHPKSAVGFFARGKSSAPIQAPGFGQSSHSALRLCHAFPTVADLVIDSHVGPSDSRRLERPAEPSDHDSDWTSQWRIDPKRGHPGTHDRMEPQRIRTVDAVSTQVQSRQARLPSPGFTGSPSWPSNPSNGSLHLANERQMRSSQDVTHQWRREAPQARLPSDPSKHRIPTNRSEQLMVRSKASDDGGSLQSGSRWSNLGPPRSVPSETSLRRMVFGQLIPRDYIPPPERLRPAPPTPAHETRLESTPTERQPSMFNDPRRPPPISNSIWPLHPDEYHPGTQTFEDFATPIKIVREEPIKITISPIRSERSPPLPLRLISPRNTHHSSWPRTPRQAYEFRRDVEMSRTPQAARVGSFFSPGFEPIQLFSDYNEPQYSHRPLFQDQAQVYDSPNWTPSHRYKTFDNPDQSVASVYQERTDATTSEYRFNSGSIPQVDTRWRDTEDSAAQEVEMFGASTGDWSKMWQARRDVL